MLLATLIETPLALLSDRVPRGRLLRLALLALAMMLALGAVARTPWLLGVALGLAGAASGVACACAQGELVGAHGGDAGRAMTRWTTFAAAGDVLAPLLVAVVLFAGGSYRAGTRHTARRSCQPERHPQQPRGAGDRAERQHHRQSQQGQPQQTPPRHAIREQRERRLDQRRQ